MDIWPLDWDAMLGAERAVWRATQAIRNDAARPSPASQMSKLLTNEPLVQGRLLKALLQFVLAAVLWVVWLGWIIHLWSIIDAALFDPRKD